MGGLNQVLLKLAQAGMARNEKAAFVPMVGDPSQGGGQPAGGDPAQDPMAMAAQGQDPAAIMAAQGQPVDPNVAAAGGATGMPPAGGPPAGGAPAGAPQAAPIDPTIQAAIDQSIQTAMSQQGGGAGGAGAGKGGKNELNLKVNEIHTMLTKILGVLVGKGEIPAEELGLVASRDQSAAGVPAEQKMAAAAGQAPEPMGQSVVEAAPLSQEAQEKVGNALANLIISLRG